MIKIVKLNDRTFKVTVQSAQTTTHTVTVDEEYFQKLTSGSATIEELVRKSFEFLLERENNSSILGQFDLSVISRYFPEYEAEIKKMITS